MTVAPRRYWCAGLAWVLRCRILRLDSRCVQADIRGPLPSQRAGYLGMFTDVISRHGANRDDAALAVLIRDGNGPSGRISCSYHPLDVNVRHVGLRHCEVQRCQRARAVHSYIRRDQASRRYTVGGSKMNDHCSSMNAEYLDVLARQHAHHEPAKMRRRAEATNVQRAHEEAGTSLRDRGDGQPGANLYPSLLCQGGKAQRHKRAVLQGQIGRTLSSMKGNQRAAESRLCGQRGTMWLRFDYEAGGHSNDGDSGDGGPVEGAIG